MKSLLITLFLLPLYITALCWERQTSFNVESTYSDSALNDGLTQSESDTAHLIAWLDSPCYNIFANVTPDPASVAASSPFYMALKTNMLYDLAAVPNIAVEFYIGKNWSISGGWNYAWWSNHNSHRSWKFSGGDISLRRWFGQSEAHKPLTGHHIGIYGQRFAYDFAFGGRGYLGGKPGGNPLQDASYSIGIEYGFSLPVARRINIDFSIGVGYMGGKYYEYCPIDNCDVWQATKNRCWFGPTKAEISLVWLIGNGNYNCKKGGKL